MTVEAYILKVLDEYIDCSFIAIKLPVNYDNNHLKQVVTTNQPHSYKYQMMTLHKMTLTLISR